MDDTFTIEHLQRLLKYMRELQAPGPYMLWTPRGFIYLDDEGTIVEGNEDAIQWLKDQESPIRLTDPTQINMDTHNKPTHGKYRKRNPGLTVMQELRVLTMYEQIKRLKNE